MDACPYCGGGITAFDIVSRTRTARYHEDCRTRELGLPYEPWLPIRIVLFLWDARFAAWNVVRVVWGELGGSKRSLGRALDLTRPNAAREEKARDEAMKHRDLWL